MNCVDDCSDDEFFIGCITSVNSVDTSEWCENLKIEDKVVKVQLDTGAKVNVISTRVLQDSASRYPCKKTQVKAPTVLRAQTCKDLGLLARVQLLQQQSLLTSPEGMAQNMYEQYSDLFQGLGCLPGEHTIKVDSNISPVVHPP